MGTTVKYITSALEKYRFSDAALRLHGFVWDEFANTYLEKTKSNTDGGETFTVLVRVFTTCLKLLHPFMPFVTESIWQEFSKAHLVDESLLMTAEWPKSV